jgi:hypothetical protein
MNAKKFLTIAMFVVLSGLVGGCHYGSSDGYRGYGSGYGSASGSGAYREGYRDGRAAERRRDAWADSGYYNRPYWRR